ncbi:MAG: hypothetical protein HY761_08265 [Candidatus Omnitrophica bacterium]|nr:hypothetical protein [Candidatus Omnitrophota bacterium]
MKNKIILFSFVFSVLIVMVSIFIMNKIYKSSTSLYPEKLPYDKTPEQGLRRQLVPSRPEDYGMVESGKDMAQEEWDSLISKKIKKIKPQINAVDLDKINEKIKESPQVTKDKIRQIDESIEKCKLILKNDPGNKDVRGKLTRLMMLRSIAENLPEAGK